eukprot:TRINITY_DN15067_c0_g1_i1.p1 TRINITY_DN15067_c0_g1~~TRINITY_DN15067_c0_g1_i1.p1  ORF type:complete len:453 (+),score=74.75 TRINITY_DN15067_c0_g1_i1:69-1427(+)
MTATESRTEDQKLIPEKPRDAFYARFSSRKRRLILLVVCSGVILTPVADTIYLPSLTFVERDLDASQLLVSLTVALYILIVGFLPLVTGPLSERYGRRAVMLPSVAFFVACSVGAAFSPSIDVLLALRALQACGVCATMVIGQAIVSDVYPDQERGFAFGFFGISVQVGPVLGPIIGGALAEWKTWRSTFIFVAAIGALVLLLEIFFLPETNHYTIQQVNLKSGNEPIAGTIPRPKFEPPWYPLSFYRFPLVAWLSWSIGVAMSSMFLTTVILPIVMTTIYKFDQWQAGLVFLPYGVASMIGSNLGGLVSHRLQAKFGVCESQLLSFVIGVYCMVPGLAVFAWLGEVYLAAAIAATTPVGFGASFMISGAMSYVTQAYPQNFGAALSSVSVGQFGLSFFVIFFGPMARTVVGTSWLFTFMAGLISISLLPGAIWTGVFLSRSSRGTTPLSVN